MYDVVQDYIKIWELRWKRNHHCQCHNVNEPSLNAMLRARGPVIRLISSPTRVDHLQPVHQVLLKRLLFSFTGLSSLQVSKVPSLRMSESPIQTPPVRGRDVMEVGMSAASASCSSWLLKTENLKPKTCSCWLSTVARVPPCCTHTVSASNQSSEAEESCQHLVDDIWENALYLTTQTTYTIYKPGSIRQGKQWQAGLLLCWLWWWWWSAPLWWSSWSPSWPGRWTGRLPRRWLENKYLRRFHTGPCIGQNLCRTKNKHWNEDCRELVENKIWAKMMIIIWGSVRLVVVHQKIKIR